MQRWKIGDVRVTRIIEMQLPGITFILPDATNENLAKIPWLKPHFVDENGEGVASVHMLVIESGDRKIVVDTCIGNDKTLPMKFWCNLKTPFMETFRGAGFDPDGIDTVLCTHLHPDHVGWNTSLVDGKWVPTFPKADYLWGRVEWEHWQANPMPGMEPLFEQSVRPIVDAGLNTLVEVDHAITDEVWLEPTPGHTPGHVSVRIKSQGVDAVITGDLMHHPCQMAHPNWHCTADSDKAQAVQTRRRFMETYSDSPTLIIGTHFATPTAGKIVRDGDVWRFEVE